MFSSLNLDNAPVQSTVYSVQCTHYTVSRLINISNTIIFHPTLLCRLPHACILYMYSLYSVYILKSTNSMYVTIMQCVYFTASAYPHELARKKL